jgi:hypothetical protein
LFRLAPLAEGGPTDGLLSGATLELSLAISTIAARNHCHDPEAVVERQQCRSLHHGGDLRLRRSKLQRLEIRAQTIVA